MALAIIDDLVLISVLAMRRGSFRFGYMGIADVRVRALSVSIVVSFMPCV